MCYTSSIGDALKKQWGEKACMGPLNVFEYEVLAKERMSPTSWDFYRGKSDDDVWRATSQAALARIHLRSRPLADDASCDTTTSVLKTFVQMPLLVAPTPLYSLAQASEASWDVDACQYSL